MKSIKLGFLCAALILGLGSSIFLVNSCKNTGIPADQMPQICFKEQVLPIFQINCAIAGCHNGSRDHGYSFTSYPGIMQSIIPGNADKSKAYQAMTSTFQLMPPNNPLSENNRTIIRLWIEQGAIETSCALPVDTISNPDTTKVIIPDTTSTHTSEHRWACYDRDIRPILMSSCAVIGCHDAITQHDGVDFSTYAATLVRIKPGSPQTSPLYNAIISINGSENLMPPAPYSQLSKAAIDTIYSWIKRGGQNEVCSTSCDTIGIIGYTNHIKPILERSCSTCHGSISPKGAINLMSESTVETIAKTGRLLGALKRKAGFRPMPEAYALSSCEVRQIELWINQGYHL